jgi:hypothetical protein
MNLATFAVTALLVPVAAAQGIDTELAARYFGEARELSERDGGALWGEPLYERLLFIDPASASIVANRADPDGTLTAEGDVWVGPQPDAIGVANTAQSWQGVAWTTVIWPLPADRHDRARLLAHEMLHRVQPILGTCSFEATPNEHLDTGEGRAWLRLEWRALGEALVHDGDDRRAALTDALVFRKIRHALFEKAHAAEVALESNEGVAEYTGLKLCGLPDGVLADRAAVGLAQAERNERHGRSFAYASGPAYGILLDESGTEPGWREGFAGDADFGALAEDAYSIELPKDLREHALASLARYDGDLVLAEEARTEAARQQRLADHRARFVDGPVLLLPTSDGIRYSLGIGVSKPLLHRSERPVAHQNR